MRHQADHSSVFGDRRQLRVVQVAPMVVDGAAGGVTDEDRSLGSTLEDVGHGLRRGVREIDDHAKARDAVDQPPPELGQSSLVIAALGESVLLVPGRGSTRTPSLARRSSGQRSSPNEDTPSIANSNPRADPTPPTIAPAVDGRDLRIGFHRGVESRPSAGEPGGTRYPHPAVALRRPRRPEAPPHRPAAARANVRETDCLRPVAPRKRALAADRCDRRPSVSHPSTSREQATAKTSGLDSTAVWKLAICRRTSRNAAAGSV